MTGITLGNPRMLRATNDRAAFDLPLEGGPLSWARIGKLTRLSKSAPHNCCRGWRHPEPDGRFGELPRERASAAIPGGAPPVPGAALPGSGDAGARGRAGRPGKHSGRTARRSGTGQGSTALGEWGVRMTVRRARRARQAQDPVKSGSAPAPRGHTAGRTAASRRFGDGRADAGDRGGPRVRRGERATRTGGRANACGCSRAAAGHGSAPGDHRSGSHRSGEHGPPRPADPSGRTRSPARCRRPARPPLPRRCRRAGARRPPGAVRGARPPSGGGRGERGRPGRGGRDGGGDAAARGGPRGRTGRAR